MRRSRLRRGVFERVERRTSHLKKMRKELDAGSEPSQVVRRGDRGGMAGEDESVERDREGTVAGTGCTSLGTRL